MKLITSIFIILSALIVMTSYSSPGSVEKLGESFMTALRDGDAVASWDMLTEDIQNEIGDQAIWEEFVALHNFSKWSFFNSVLVQNSPEIFGEATLGEDTYNVTLGFTQVNNVWRISSLSINIIE